MIKTYSASGLRLRDRSLESVLKLEELKRVSLKRDTRGVVRLCQFLSDVGGTNPIKKTAHMGQAYSFRQYVGGASYAWTHRDLAGRAEVEALYGGAAIERQELDHYLRGIFVRVAVDCMRKPAAEPVATAQTLRRANVANVADARAQLKAQLDAKTNLERAA